MHKRLWLLPSLALAAIAAGCGSRQQPGWQTCVDSKGRVANEVNCQNEARQSHGVNPWLFRWYYYPYGGQPYPLGYGVPQGGSYATEPFAGVATRSLGVPRSGASVPSVRGGFGSTAFGAVGG